MAMLFTSLQAQMFVDLGLRLDGLVLDVGCGDGRFADILKGLGIIERSPCGTDISRTELLKAKATNTHFALVQADASALPFKNEAFHSVLSSGVLCCIPMGIKRPLREVHRVLQEGWHLATVPTERFMTLMILSRIFQSVWPSLSSTYERKLSDRLGHYNVYSSQEWANKFEENGYRVIENRQFFDSHEAAIWNVLSMQMFRVFGVLKFIHSDVLTKLLGGMWQALLNWLLKVIRRGSDGHGYTLLVASKSQ